MNYSGSSFGLTFSSTTPESKTIPTNPLNPWFLSAGLSPLILKRLPQLLFYIGIPNFSPYKSQTIKDDVKKIFGPLKRKKSGSELSGIDEHLACTKVRKVISPEPQKSLEHFREALKEEKKKSSSLEETLVFALIDPKPPKGAEISPLQTTESIGKSG
jgi:hypothetical protein